MVVVVSISPVVDYFGLSLENWPDLDTSCTCVRVCGVGGKDKVFPEQMNIRLEVHSMELSYSTELFFKMDIWYSL